MDIKITEHERIRVIDGQDIYGIMRKILLREEQIDQEKEHFWMVGLDVSRRLLFIELVVIGGAYHANIKPAEAFRVAVWKNATSVVLVHNCYGSRYFGGSVPHTGRGNRGTSRQPDSAHGQRILALRMCQGASFAGSRLLLDTFYAPVKSDHERHPAPMPDHGTMSLEFRRT